LAPPDVRAKLSASYPGSFSMIDNPGQNIRYFGIERRKSKERRTLVHRREEFRFEPGKDDRRNSPDRRKQGAWDDTDSR
jgi:hypothetical protein